MNSSAASNTLRKRSRPSMTQRARTSSWPLSRDDGMRVGDILYFAPGIRFRDVDVNGARLPDQYRQRIVGFYVEPAEGCAASRQAFASGVLLVSCIDALARVRFSERSVGDRIKRFAREEL